MPDMPELVAIEADEAYFDTLEAAGNRWTDSMEVRVATEMSARHGAYAKVYAAGRESMLTREEWRVCGGPANKQLPEEYQFPYIFASEIESSEEATAELAQARNQWRSEDSWIEHRRTGATDWERVPDGDL